jgi:hypothetical protein
MTSETELTTNVKQKNKTQPKYEAVAHIWVV